MGKHRPSPSGTPAAILIQQNRPDADTTDVLPAFREPPTPRRLAPWAAGLAVAGTVAAGVIVAPSVVGDSPIPSAPPTSPDHTQPQTRDEVTDLLAEMASSQQAQQRERAAITASAQAAAEAAASATAAREAQEAAEAGARAQEAAAASQAAQDVMQTVGGALTVTAIANITNSAGPVHARTQAAADAVVSNVPGAADITLGGTRSSAVDPDGHPSGNAIDYMVGADSDLGDAIAAYNIANWDILGVEYIIWKQRILMSPTGAWEPMEDRGGATANHYDHVHINYRP